MKYTVRKNNFGLWVVADPAGKVHGFRGRPMAFTRWDDARNLACRLADEALIKLAQKANDVVWRTPMYSTYELYGDEHAKYTRLNRLLVGRAMAKALSEAA
ncbi:hypothetical protein JRC04_04585 [Mycolicibacterium sp. S2-37]|uniref:hypothetical protein n=1 Tax=Mycolicibacterium sp. S2-37 TaxID=2810297 RepID=UPI001A93F2F1|nr:hypothetical protein [Mycolicibacterium sp. S2-37]MBO0676735.1 hypothetical protein [Mycolicibacterium sp. S2-37]